MARTRLFTRINWFNKVNRRASQGQVNPDHTVRPLKPWISLVGTRASAAEADVCAICRDAMTGPKKLLFNSVVDTSTIGDVSSTCSRRKSCRLCQTKIPAELQEKAMIFVIKRLHKRTTVDPRNKFCDLYLVE